jgi:hypothetical protein
MHGRWGCHYSATGTSAARWHSSLVPAAISSGWIYCHLGLLEAGDGELELAAEPRLGELYTGMPLPTLMSVRLWRPAQKPPPVYVTIIVSRPLLPPRHVNLSTHEAVRPSVSRPDQVIYPSRSRLECTNCSRWHHHHHSPRQHQARGRRRPLAKTKPLLKCAAASLNKQAQANAGSTLCFGTTPFVHHHRHTLQHARPRRMLQPTHISRIATWKGSGKLPPLIPNDRCGAA